MNSGVPAQATWATSDGSPWWLRDSAYSQPSGDYTANCFLDILGHPENENTITFDDDTCNVHSRSYYCQSLKTTTTTTVAVAPAPAPVADTATATWESDGRKVHLFKTAKGVDLRTQTTFCTDKSLLWWSPKSQADAQALITKAYEADNGHTWIQLHNVAMALPATIGGFAVTVDDGSCTSVGTKEWSAVRKVGCSVCDPELNEWKSSCWDHNEYDWFACEDV